MYYLINQSLTKLTNNEHLKVNDNLLTVPLNVFNFVTNGTP